METLPGSVISETFDYIDVDQLGDLRTVSHAWRDALSPAAGRHIVCKAMGPEGSTKLLTKFLQSHGKFTRSITLRKINKEIVDLLGKHCKEACSLSVSFSESQKMQTEVVLVLTLAKHLKKLKMAKFCASFDKSLVKGLEPIIKKVSTLILSCGPQSSSGYYTSASSSEFLIGVTSPSIKEFTLLNLTIDGDMFARLIQGFKKLEFFHSVPGPKQVRDFSFSYDVKRAKFREIRITNCSDVVLADIVFNSASENMNLEPPQKKIKRPNTSTHLKNFRTLELLDAYDLISKYSKKLPPIKSIRFEINDDAEIEGFDINKAILDFQNVENLAVEIKYQGVGKLAMDCVKLKAKSLYFSSALPFGSNYALWLINHFPLLQDLYLPKGSSNDLMQIANNGSVFASLQRVFVYDEKKMSFWEKLVKIAPKLYQINIKLKSPHRSELMTRFPNLLIGVYSGPKHFLGPLSTSIKGVDNGGRRSHSSNYPDSAYMDTSKPTSPEPHEEDSGHYSLGNGSEEESHSESSYFM